MKKFREPIIVSTATISRIEQFQLSRTADEVHMVLAHVGSDLDHDDSEESSTEGEVDSEDT